MKRIGDAVCRVRSARFPVRSRNRNLVRPGLSTSLLPFFLSPCYSSRSADSLTVTQEKKPIDSHSVSLSSNAKWDGDLKYHNNSPLTSTSQLLSILVAVTMVGSNTLVPTNVREELQKYGQEHLLKYIDNDELSAEEAKSLLQDIQALDLAKISSIYRHCFQKKDATVGEKGEGETSTRADANATPSDTQSVPLFEPLDKFDCVKDLEQSGQKGQKTMVGLRAIARGEVAAVVLAGGQGTRLGFAGPKGLYNVGLPSEKTLFHLFAERIIRLQVEAQLFLEQEKENARKERMGDQEGATDAGALSSSSSSSSLSMDLTDPLSLHAGQGKIKIPWYIMTSKMNHEETQLFFERNKFFGMDPEQVFFFPQGTLPAMDTEGKIILETKSKISLASDGNGGIYPALAQSGAIDDMKRRGVRALHVFSVDNILVRPADPLFVGYCLEQDADCGNLVVWKEDWKEKVGVVGKKDGQFCIIEYSELDEESMQKIDSNGKLLFGAGNICNHFYTLSFLEDVVLPNMDLNYHVAHKKIPYCSDNGETVKPEEPNGIKFECFIFDVFPLAKNMAVLEVNREDSFSPVKNAPGEATDSPDTARKMLSDLHKSWFKAAGGEIKNEDKNLLEISPLVSYSGDFLSSKVQGMSIDLEKECFELDC